MTHRRGGGDGGSLYLLHHTGRSSQPSMLHRSGDDSPFTSFFMRRPIWMPWWRLWGGGLLLHFMFDMVVRRRGQRWSAVTEGPPEQDLHLSL